MVYFQVDAYVECGKKWSIIIIPLEAYFYMFQIYLWMCKEGHKREVNAQNFSMSKFWGPMSY